MAALMKVTVEHTDGERATYTILPKTVVAFERKFAVGFGALATDLRMEWVYWLAWDAEHSAGKVVKPFDDWLAEVTSVEAEDDAAPLAAAPSPAT